MVLEEIGSKITQALRKMTSSVTLDDGVIDEMIESISTALSSSDVDIELVNKLRTNIRAKVKLDDMASGVNKRKAVEATVIQELYGLLDCGKMPYIPTRGKTNVVMFVGLQGSGKTTSCTKYAYYYKRKGFKVALVCADTFRAGA
jgi:signal recognition particle subunit SRP54